MLVEELLEVRVLEVRQRAVGELEDVVRQVLHQDVGARLAGGAQLVLGRIGVEGVESVAAVELALQPLQRAFRYLNGLALSGGGCCLACLSHRMKS